MRFAKSVRASDRSEQAGTIARDLLVTFGGERPASLSALMPEVVDRVTPEGRVPDDTRLLASVDDLTRKLGLT